MSAQNPRFRKIVATHEITVDETTGLQWQAVPFPERMTHKEAVKACAELRLGGHSDWRLPTRVELLTVVDDTRHDPAIDTDAFPNTPSAWFWTSTPSAEAPSEYAWVVSFHHGGAGVGVRGAHSRVRAVRGPARQ